MKLESTISKMHSIKTYLFVSLCLWFIESQAVVLSEIMFNPEGEEGSDEFIELYNESGNPVSLTGWTVSDGEGSDTLVNAGMGLTAGPHQYILIMDPDYTEDGSTTYSGLIPESALIVKISGSTFGSRGLSNSVSETITIATANNNIVAEYAYNIDVLPGHSTEKIMMTGGDTNDNWGQSVSVNGTPGARNSITPPENDLAIKRIEASPQFPVTDEDFTITIDVENRGLNPANDSLHLFELASLSDPQGTLIKSWQTSVISPGDTAAFEHSMQMGENSIRILKAVLARTDDIPNNNVAYLTVGAAGIVGGIVINEIMYQPESGLSEWIELYNCTSASILLEGWSFADGSGIADTSKRFIIESTVIDSSSYMIIASDSMIYFEDIPENVPVLIWDSSYPSLNNAGDSLVLYDSQDQIIDRVDYRSNWGTSTAGQSLERVSVQSSSNDPLNWASSLDLSGNTAGRMNSRAIQATTFGMDLIELQPNPFSPDGDGWDDLLAIRYHLDEADSRLDVKIFDVRGRQVRFLCNNIPAGFQGEVLWDGKSDTGRELPTGMYIIYLEALGQGGSSIQSGKRVVALARPS